jgi:hypothetical protein
MYTTTTICVIAMLQAPPLGPHAGGAVALSLELDICLLLRLPVTPSAPLTPLALSCAPRAPHHLTSKTFILSDIAHMHQSYVNVRSGRCTVVYGGVRWCTVVYGGVRWCTVVCSGVWVEMVAAEESGRCTVVYGGVRWCAVVYGLRWWLQKMVYKAVCEP